MKELSSAVMLPVTIGIVYTIVCVNDVINSANIGIVLCVIICIKLKTFDTSVKIVWTVHAKIIINDAANWGVIVSAAALAVLEITTTNSHMTINIFSANDWTEVVFVKLFVIDVKTVLKNDNIVDCTDLTAVVNELVNDVYEDVVVVIVVIDVLTDSNTLPILTFKFCRITFDVSKVADDRLATSLDTSRIDDIIEVAKLPTSVPSLILLRTFDRSAVVGVVCVVVVMVTTFLDSVVDTVLNNVNKLV